MQPQIRYSATEFDIRSSSDGNTLVGHAAVFNSETIIAGAFREQIAPRAFRKSIKEHDVRALFNHDPNLVLGRNKSGTLRLKEDDIGLSYEVDLPDTQAARDLWTLIDRGDVSGSSFAFDPVKQEVKQADAEAGETLPLYTVREARLYDVSPVVFPAYEDTEVLARGVVLAASLSGRTIQEVREAIEAGEPSRIWTPGEDATTAEPLAEPLDAQHSGDTRQPEPRTSYPIYM